MSQLQSPDLPPTVYHRDQGLNRLPPSPPQLQLCNAIKMANRNRIHLSKARAAKSAEKAAPKAASSAGVGSESQQPRKCGAGSGRLLRYLADRWP